MGFSFKDKKYLEPGFPVQSPDFPLEARKTKIVNGYYEEFTINRKFNSAVIYSYYNGYNYPKRITLYSAGNYRKYKLNAPSRPLALKISVPMVYHNADDNKNYYYGRYLDSYLIISKSSTGIKNYYWNDYNSNVALYTNKDTGEIEREEKHITGEYNVSLNNNSSSSNVSLSTIKSKIKNYFNTIENLSNADYMAETLWNNINEFCKKAGNSENGASIFYCNTNFIDFLYNTQIYNIVSEKLTIPMYNLNQGEQARNYLENGTKALFDETGTPENIDDIIISTQDIVLNTNWNVYLQTGTMQSTIIWQTPYFSENNIDTKTAIAIFYDENGNYINKRPYKSSITFNINELPDYLKKQYKENGYYILKFRIQYNNAISSLCYAKIESVITEYGVEEPTDGSTINIFYNKYPDYDTDYDNNKDNTDDDITNGSTIGGGESSYNALNVISRTYYITTSNLRSLSQFLWSDNFTQNIKLLNNDPIENIVSCKMLPFVLHGSESNVICGNVDTGVKAETIANNYYNIIGSINIPSYYNNFLDYAPYTKLTIFLPFIGFKELDCNLYIGKTLTVAYIHDIITGTCKAMLYSDNIYVQSFDGISGIDIPLTASNNSQIANAFINSAVGSVAQFFGDPIGGLLSLGKATVSSALATQHYSTQGSYSPSCGAYETHVCYIIVDRPSMQYSKTYNHDYGRPCNLSQTIGNLKGFTKMCENIDCSGISCTENEKEMIRQLLTSGIYV